MSQVMDMAKRLQDTERTIAELRDALGQASLPARRDLDSPEQVPPVDGQAMAIQSPRTVDFSDSDGQLISDLSLDENGKASLFTIPYVITGIGFTDPWKALLSWPNICCTRTAARFDK